MDAALAEIRQSLATADEVTRQRISLELFKLAYDVESPDEMLRRVGSLHLQSATMIAGIQNGLFSELSKTQEAFTAETLAEKCSGDVQLIDRILTFLAATGAVDEVAKSTYVANNFTKNLATPVASAGLKHYFYTVAPQYQALPDFLERTGYKNPNDEVHTVFQDAWQTNLHGFAWFASHPKNLEYFNDYMAKRRWPELSWLSVYPVDEETKVLNDRERPLYVNVGGGIGHQSAEFKQKHPEIPGRVILEDLPHSIAKALPTPGVENIAHNFFEPQPIKGAKFYFIRGVLHNHPDHKVKLLLSNIRDVMAPDSILLLDEVVLPETGVNYEASAQDLTMMAAFAATERSESQFKALFDELGFKLIKSRMYNPPSYETVMDVRLV